MKSGELVVGLVNNPGKDEPKALWIRVVRVLEKSEALDLLRNN